VVRRRAMYATVGVLLCAAACSPGHAKLDIGMRKMAVDLAFKDESLPAPPPEIRRVFEKILVPPPNLPAFSANFKPLPALKAFEYCPKAPPGVVPQEAVTLRITKPPRAGKYIYIVAGKVKVTLPPPIGAVTLTMPPIMQTEIRHLTKASYTNSSGNPAQATQYENFVRLGVVTVTELYQLRDDGVYLLQRELNSGAQKVTFHPTSPVQIYQFGREGTNWTTGGADADTKVAMAFQGRISRRERVDVCGTVLDSYRADSAENVVTSDGSYQSQTDRFADCPSQAGTTCGAKPNSRDYATHIGPIPVREEFHYTDQVVVASSNGPQTATVKWDYVMTLARLQPLS